MNYLLSIIFLALFIVFPAGCKSGKGGNNQVAVQDSADKVKTVTAQPVEQGPGSDVYTKYCLACHQPDGNGMKGMFPPLAGNDKIKGPANELIPIVLFGLEGTITVNGQEQNYNQVMPAQDYLTDQQIADVLTYIRSSWGNKAPSVSPDEVGEIRKKGKE
ncbi:MAG TPA: cytochrome c [Bacteroidales bacterium]|jgi:mono/diheme cytochrome c family protein|nr:cytochrome c [Bacteroidales bacterium]